MEDNRVGLETTDEKQFSLTELFNIQFTYALMYGMKPDDYWHGEAELFWAYRTSFLKKQEVEFERENALLWLGGIYQRQALYDWWTHSHDTKGKVDYFEKPINHSKEKEKELELKEEEKKLQNERNIRFMVSKSHNALIKSQKKK